MNPSRTPRSLPEDEEMDPVGKPYSDQEPLLPNEDDDDDLRDPVFSPDTAPDTPVDPESERVVQPKPPNP